MEKLHVASVELYPFENSEKHFTDRFELVHLENPSAVVRRGIEFFLAVRFSNRNYDPNKDILRLNFSFGPHPSPIKGTKAVISVGTATDILRNWEITTLGEDDQSISLSIRSPHTAPVGQWKLFVETKLKDNVSEKPEIYEHPGDIYILFNPWNKGDQVYMEDTRLLDEYVLNDVGKIWVGPWGRSRGREWVFGQFDAVVLPAAMMIMDRSNVTPANRSDPVLVTRAISKLVNSNDDLGVLTGRWDGNYDDGTAPAAWTGSVPILEEFYNTGHDVKYGQCWVFAGVVTTVCRALGIPSRVVSNLVSAHDANATLTIDRYYDEDNEELDYDPNNPYGEDSIWNYHVWNDVWMARPDLPKGYGGWQAIDATPQETSDGVYQCGPASLEAIRCGAVGFNYDVSFLLATVNADLIRWKLDEQAELGLSKIDTNSYHIGRMILTKQPWIFDPNGDKDRQEITDQYKSEEGSKAERLTLMNGVRGTERAKRFFMLPTKSQVDIEFELVDIESVNIGEDYSVMVRINNKSSEPRKVQAVLSSASVYYTGIRAHLIKKATGDFTVQPNNKEVLKLKVKADEYLDKLVEYCNMKIFAIATVHETRETWADEDDFQVLKPSIDIKITDAENGIYINKPVAVVFSFNNPLKKTLTNCIFRYEGPGLSKPQVINYRNVPASGEIRLEHSFTPMAAGKRQLIATFASRQLVDVTGSTTIDVLELED